MGLTIEKGMPKLTNEALEELYYCEGQFTNAGDQRNPSHFIWSFYAVATKNMVRKIVSSRILSIICWDTRELARPIVQ